MKANEFKLFLGVSVLVYAGLYHANIPDYRFVLWAAQHYFGAQDDSTVWLCRDGLRIVEAVAIAGGFTAVVSYFRNGKTVIAEKGE